jgi:hypothetical protein
VATVRRKLYGVTHCNASGSAARSARRMFARLIHPPSRLANTGLVYRRNLAGTSIPQEITGLYRRLHTASANGSESDSAAGELEREDLVDSVSAAKILECTPRWVTEIHADHDGKKIGRHWVFRRQTVVDYAAAKGRWQWQRSSSYR